MTFPSIRWVSVVCSFVLASFVGDLAHAGKAGVENGRYAGRIYVLQSILLANQSYTIETLNLSTGADTVLHVQSRPSGEYLDGNDDCGSRLAGCTGYRSYLTIPSSSTTRNVWIIVRGYGPSSGGTGTLRITPAGSTPINFPISFTGGYKKTFSTIRAAAHFRTVEELGGLSDTVLLVTSQRADRVAAFDDDNGVGNMSWAHLNEFCGSSCSVIVGGYGNEGTTTLIWDEDADYVDYDHDGLSDTLEGVIGTDPWEIDTDMDGIEDAEELVGVDVPSNLLRFPMYGTNPLVRDLFVEADWKKCVPSGINDHTCDSMKKPADPDAWQMTGDMAVQVDQYLGSDVSVRIDTGLDNTNSSTKSIYNNWKGASQRPESWTGDKCQFLSPDRVGYFHGARLYESNKGGFRNYPPLSGCIDSPVYPATFAHELGHNLNLSHGGKQSAGPDMNCKTNYLSIMNYAFSYDPSSGLTAFSSNIFAGTVLNPLQMSETVGLGTTDIDKLGVVTGPGFGYYVDPITGAIDWNRDGRISSNPVRAAPTFGSSGCRASQYQADNGQLGRRYSALSYWPKPNSDPRLYWFTRRESDGKLEYRYATSYPDNCSSPPSVSCRTNWSPAMASAAQDVPSVLAGKDAPAATWYQDASGTKQLILVYKDMDSHLRFQKLRVVWLDSWSSPAYVGSGSEVIDGSPAAVA